MKHQLIWKKIFAGLLWVVLVGVLAVGVWGICSGDAEFWKSISSLLGTLTAVATGLVHCYSPTMHRKKREFYEQAYRDVLGEAFVRNPLRRWRLLRAVRWYDEKQYARAERILRRLCKKCDEVADSCAVLLVFGLCYTAQNLHRKATEVYRLLLELDPWNVRANNNLGYQLYRMGNLPAAMEHFDRAMTAAPDYAPAYLNAANGYFKQGDPARAEQYANMALERDAESTGAMTLLAILAALRGDSAQEAYYTGMAVENGYQEEKLKQAIRFYRNAQMERENERDEET